VGATEIEPMTSTVSSTSERKLDKGFSVLGCAGARKIPQENCESAPGAHPGNIMEFLASSSEKQVTLCVRGLNPSRKHRNGFIETHNSDDDDYPEPKK
jgi:hypothetical protein